MWLESAWEWERQFPASRISAWDNPLYGVPLRPPRRLNTDPSEFSMVGQQPGPALPEARKFLPVSSDPPGLTVWLELFHRSGLAKPKFCSYDLTRTEQVCSVPDPECCGLAGAAGGGGGGRQAGHHRKHGQDGGEGDR